MAYTTLTAVRAELKLTETTDDSLISGYITIAQRIIEAPKPLGTGRVFEVVSDTTRNLDAPADASDRGPDSPIFLLLLMPAGDLCSITSIVNGDGTTVSASDYVTEPRYTTPYHGIRLKQGSGLTWTSEDSPEGAIAITGKWGYSVTAPADIQRAALRLVVWMYRERDNAGFDIDMKTEEGLILGARMPRDIRQIIETYWSLV